MLPYRVEHLCAISPPLESPQSLAQFFSTQTNLEVSGIKLVLPCSCLHCFLQCRSSFGQLRCVCSSVCVSVCVFLSVWLSSGVPLPNYSRSMAAEKIGCGIKKKLLLLNCSKIIIVITLIITLIRTKFKIVDFQVLK